LGEPDDAAGTICVDLSDVEDEGPFSEEEMFIQ